MSTILKALRRLEQEKAPTTRPLREQVTGPDGDDREEAAPARRWPILLAGIGAGVMAGAAVLFLVLSRSDSLPPPAASQPVPAAAIVPPAAAPAPAASDDVEVIDRGNPAPRVMAPEPAETADAAPATQPAPGSVRPFQHAERRSQAKPRPPAQARVIAEPPLQAPVPPPQPVVEVAVSQAAKAPVPAAAPARPEAVQAASRPLVQAASRPPPPDPFPALRVERTTWHPLADRRLAVVDVPGEGARELREGDPVAGATVSLIEPSGVVFRYEGRDVRRKVGGRP